MKPANLDNQINWIFSKLTSDLSIWKNITDQFKIDLFSGLFMEAQNRGLSISSKSMQLISERGINFGLDIYNVEKDI